MRRKLLSVLLGLAMVITLLGGCGKTDKPAEETDADTGTEKGEEVSDEGASSEKLKDEIHVAMNSVPTNLDIVVNTATIATEVAHETIFEQLVAMDSSYKPVLELAESFTVNDDSTEYVYVLRKGILFHDGQEMKADDVVASMNRWINSAGNVQAMVGESRFEKVDDYTVRIALSTPCAYMNELIAGFGQRASIMPAAVINAIDETGIVSEYIGTGPYKFAEWVDNQYIKLTRNDSYQPYGTKGDFSGWAGYKEANTRDIYFDFVSDSSTILAGLQTGEYDVSMDVGYDNYDMFANDGNFNVQMATSEMPMLIFNKKEGLGADPILRQAVQAAINCSDIMYATYGNEKFYDLYSSYMFDSQKDWYTEEGSEFYNQNDIERAKELLADAGYNGDPFTILVASDNEDFYNMAIVIQDQLKAAGMNCELSTYDWATFVTIRNEQPDQYNAFITNFSPKILPTMNLFLSSSWAGWVSDPVILDGLTAINSETSMAEAVQKWFTLQKYMYETSVPVVKFGNNKSLMVATTKFDGLQLFEHIVFVNAKLYE